MAVYYNVIFDFVKFGISSHFILFRGSLLLTGKFSFWQDRVDALACQGRANFLG